MTLVRTHRDFCKALLFQYDAIKLSSTSFDLGFTGEAIRLANSIWVLLGRSKTRNHTSIIDHLQWGTELEMPTSVVEGNTGGNTMIQASLTAFENVDGRSAKVKVQIEPRGHPPGNCRKLPLEQWWMEQIAKPGGQSMSRYTLIRVLRNQDGGAHLDDEITDKDFVAFNNFAPFNIRGKDGKTIPVKFHIETTVRQVAYEVLAGLKASSMRAEYYLGESHPP